MPHQCLHCGAVFSEGTPAILKGCPRCGGTKFFFTEKPLDEADRKKLTDIASKDIKVLVKDILTRQPTFKSQEQKLEKEWFQYIPERQSMKGPVEIKEKRILGVRKVKKAKKILERIKKEKREEEKEIAEKKVEKAKKIPEEIKEEKREEEKEIAEEKSEKAKNPEVVNIVESGVYEIDVHSLLEESPIIVRRDGTYLIHLPSLFEKVILKKLGKEKDL